MIENEKQLIEVMAREICKEMGLDPDANVASSGQPAWKYKKKHVTRALLAAQAEGAEMVPSRLTEAMLISGCNDGEGGRWTDDVKATYYDAMEANPLRLQGDG